MDVTIRELNKQDFQLYKQMQTGLDEDYMLRLFHRLTEKDNRLFGLFENDQLAAIAGYTIYADEFAMLGRLRSDMRYRNKGYGTRIISHILDHALSQPSIKWVGGNTEQHNLPAQKVLKKINLPPIITLYAAQTEDLGPLVNGNEPWTEVKDINHKKEWIEKTYLNPSFETTVFPFEAYYPFPATPKLFDDFLEGVKCFENKEQSRYVLMWEEEKGKEYLHIVYPWPDFMTQDGFFETANKEFEAAKQAGSSSTIWFDLTEEEVQTLPPHHPFELPSPWMLHGSFKKDYEKRIVADSFQKAQSLIDEVEKELEDLNEELNDKEDTLDSLKDANKAIEESVYEDKQD